MSIAQNLRILNKPISELAMLPQETIMTMAQSGQIPVAFVAPILAEKAEQAKASANAAAMSEQQQMPPGTVLESLIAQNAANEAQEDMPMMAQGNMPMMGAQVPEDVGIGALPVPDEMIPGLAGGGIIAFQNRGFVEDEFDYGAATREIDAASGRNLTGEFSGLSDAAQILREEREKFLGPNQSVADLIAYNKEAEERAERRAKSQFNTRLTEIGLGLASGESPYFAANLKGAMPGIKGMSEDTAKQEEAKETRKKSELLAKGIERKEGEASFSQALAQRNAKVEADAKLKAAILAASTKTPTDTKEFAALAVIAQGPDKAAAIEAKTKMDAMIRFAEAARIASAVAGGGPERAAAATTRADTDRQRAEQTRHNAALKYQSERLKLGTPGALELISRKRDDARANKESGAKPGDPNYQNSAQEFEDSLYTQGYNQKPPESSTPKAEAKPAAALPPGIPPGSKQVGTSGGKPVYQRPDGSRVIQQ